MAKIEDLISQIPDERLRKGIAAEVKVLKKTKKFGLVFEEHLPETVRLPKLPIKPGEVVALKRESGNQLWRVKTIHKNIATCDRAVEGYPAGSESNQEFAVADLVAVRSFGDAIYPALVPVDRVERGGPDKPWHVLINADNFHALQLLLYCYEGQVDVIYIDPPYNTGARDWKYNNDYVDKTDSFRHSKWLSMMKRRLLLAKRLLKPTGVLVIAIDDNEIHHLRCLADSIFTQDLHMGTVCVRHKPGGTTTARKIARSHEYALFYAASSEVAPCMVMRTEEQMSRFKHSDGEGAFEWENFRKHGQGCRKDDRPRQHYPVWVLQTGKMRVPKMEYDEKGKNWIINELLPGGAIEIWPNKGKEKRVWLWSPENFTANPSMFKYEHKKNDHLIYKKRRPNRVGVVPNTSWNDTKYSANEHGSGMIVKIFGSTEPFDFAKSVYTVADCITVATDKKNALVLDFFAGSGTTFHATALLNSEDGGNRRCILVANNELKESVAKEMNAKGVFIGDDEYEAKGIAESVTWPRCKLVVNGKRDNGASLPGERRRCLGA